MPRDITKRNFLSIRGDAFLYSELSNTIPIKSLWWSVYSKIKIESLITKAISVVYIFHSKSNNYLKYRGVMCFF